MLNAPNVCAYLSPCVSYAPVLSYVAFVQTFSVTASVSKLPSSSYVAGVTTTSVLYPGTYSIASLKSYKNTLTAP